MGKIGQNPKIVQIWYPVAPQPYIVEKSWPDLRNSLAVGLQRGVNSICLSVHPMTCSLLWVRCLFDGYSISDFGGKWPLKWKFSKMSVWIPRRDTELCFVAKFGESRPLRSCRKVTWITTQKNSGSAGLVHFAQNGRIAPKIPWALYPLTCPGITNLVRIGCALPDLFRKDWFFGPKSNWKL